MTKKLLIILFVFASIHQSVPQIERGTFVSRPQEADVVLNRWMV
jgi:hypothetical protein